MLLYEHDRTKEIVKRLLLAAKVARVVVIIYMIIMMAVLLGVLVYLTNPGLWIIAAAVGAVVGFFLGYLVASILSVLFEWFSQFLVAQGEIVSQLRKKNKD